MGVSLIVAAVVKAASVVSTVTSAIGSAVTAGLGAVGASSTAAGVIGAGVTTGLNYAAVGGLTGGAISAATGGKFSDGLKAGARMGFSIGFGGGVGSAGGAFLSGGSQVAAFTGGAILGAGTSKALGASSQEAILTGVASGVYGLGYVNVASEANSYAPTINEVVSAAGMPATQVGIVSALSAVQAASAPQLNPGYELLPTAEKQNEEEEGEEKPASETQETFQAASRSRDIAFGGVGISKVFNPGLEPAYQSRPEASVNDLKRTAKRYRTSQIDLFATAIP